MGVKIEIDFKGLEKSINNQVEKWLNKALDFLKDYARKESPIDTWEYNSRHKIIRARDDWRTISWMLYNDTSYAEILEYGVGGKIYGYHRYWKLYMAWVGARVYTRTQDNNLKSIVDIITKSLSLK